MSPPPFEGIRTVSKNTSQNDRDNKDTPRENAGTTGTLLHRTIKRRMSRAEVETTQSEDQLVSRRG